MQRICLWHQKLKEYDEEREHLAIDIKVPIKGRRSYKPIGIGTKIWVQPWFKTEKRKDSNLQHTTHEKSIDQLTNRLFPFSIVPFSINSKTENIKVSPLIGELNKSLRNKLRFYIQIQDMFNINHRVSGREREHIQWEIAWENLLEGKCVRMREMNNLYDLRRKQMVKGNKKEKENNLTRFTKLYSFVKWP